MLCYTAAAAAVQAADGMAVVVDQAVSESKSFLFDSHSNLHKILTMLLSFSYTHMQYMTTVTRNCRSRSCKSGSRINARR
jgi:hypothetical protein